MSRRQGIGYTQSMKTAISIPDDVFEAAEQLARASGQTRSGLYSRAVREYVARHAPERVTEALDRALEHIDASTADASTAEAPAPAPDTAFAVESGRRVLEETEW